MRRFNIKIILLTSLVISGGFLLYQASAQQTFLSEQQLTLIKTNCASTKATLNQLHSSDALLRVNVGQTYESMSAKLMERFNVRSANGGYDSSSLAFSVDRYKSLLDNFRDSYIIYEKQLTSAMSINCTESPAAFYDAIALSRLKRNQIKEDVVKLNQALDEYNIVLEQFEIANRPRLTGVK